MNAAVLVKPWSRRQPAPGLDEVGAAEHRVDRDHPAGEQPQPLVGEPADRIFGEHAEPFLHAFIVGEPGAEDGEALGGAVEAGEQMDADLVGEQRVDPLRRHPAVAGDHQFVARDEQPGDVVADLDSAVEARVGAR